ncbi:MAG TPA: fatty acid desaturase [Pirellulales bacterium]|jgi:fatty acid desaturase|nr:fatty acid desaturase [Pirellulales bacterium]
MNAEASPIVAMRKLVGDLFDHRSMIYWFDLAACLVVGYGSGAIYLAARPFSIEQIAALTVSAFALFRAGSFIHEITHLRQGEMRGFATAWNIVCGIPMLMPSFFYTNHIDHHKTDRYGTIHDGEYLPLGTSPTYKIWLFLAQAIFLPGYVFLRFLLSPFTFVHPRVRQWTLERASSFVMNFRHRLVIPENAPRRLWATVELAVWLRCVVMLAVVVAGIYPWTRLIQLYVLGIAVLALNYNRNLVAHHYRNRGRKMSHLEQLEDSVNITGTGLVTELFFPLGLRYHALHHLFPGLPYHNLGTAHRRLVTTLPADSPYHTTVFPTYWSVLVELWADARASEARSEAMAA